MIKSITVLAFILTFIFASEIYQEEPKLILIQQIFGYGARYPDHTAGIIGKRDSQYQPGKLTKQGKSMHYLLGKKTYDRYWYKLFAGTPYQSNYNQSRFRVTSTDDDCTIQSAQSHIFGILEALPPLQLSFNDLPYSQPYFPGTQATQGAVYGQFGNHIHPIPIHIIQENIFAQNREQLANNSNCQKKLQQNWTGMKQLQMLNHPLYVSAINELSSYLYKTIGPYNFYEYYYNMECARYSRLMASNMFTGSSQTERALKSFYSLSSYIRFFSDKEKLRVTASRLFEEVISNMRATVNSTYSPQWVMQSADHMKIGVFLSVMEMWNVNCIYQSFVGNQTENDRCVAQIPIFGSLLLFELYEFSGSGHIVKVNYNGRYLLIPFCQYREECTLKQFSVWVDGWRIRTRQNNFRVNYSYYVEISLTLLGFIAASIVSRLVSRGI